MPPPPPARHRVGRAVLAVRRSCADWLARPLASLHLLLAVFGLLTVFGLVMVLSASGAAAVARGTSPYAVVGRQAAFCGIGLILFWVGLRVPLARLRAISAVALAVATVLLVAVLVPGIGASISGARKWFVVAGQSFQPAEPAKVALALWGAHVLTLRRRLLHRWRGALVPLLPVSVVLLALVVLQPDLGTAVSLAIVVGALLFFAGAPGKLLATMVGGGLLGVVVLGLSASYRSSRITSFLSPDTDQLGAAYQSTQALYSLADGGLFGVGLGEGRAQWNYLPNAANDFIFAVVGEDFGLVGGIVVLALFAILAYTGMRIAARNTDPWVTLVTATLTAWLVAQAVINVGYVVGLLPVTGIPLPLVSSGGTSLVVTMFVFGVLANAARHEAEAAAALLARGPGRTARLLGLRPPRPVAGPARARTTRRPRPVGS